jgi:hypothetical protein
MMEIIMIKENMSKKISTVTMYSLDRMATTIISKGGKHNG